MSIELRARGKVLNWLEGLKKFDLFSKHMRQPGVPLRKVKVKDTFIWFFNHSQTAFVSVHGFPRRESPVPRLSPRRSSQLQWLNPRFPHHRQPLLSEPPGASRRRWTCLNITAFTKNSCKKKISTLWLVQITRNHYKNDILNNYNNEILLLWYSVFDKNNKWCMLSAGHTQAFDYSFICLMNKHYSILHWKLT